MSNRWITDIDKQEAVIWNIIQQLLATHKRPSNMSDTNMEKILEALDDLLDKKLAKQKAEFIEEVSRKFKNEIDELNGHIFQLQQDNDNLKQRVAYLEKERQTEKDNVASAKAHAIENDQYARRNNMVVFGINEQEKNPAEAIRKIIKEKIKISLKADDIEICHRLGKKTLNKNRPVIVRFRYRDVKWEVISERKALKGTGVIFAEDMCKELQDLQKTVSGHPNVQSCWAWNGKVQAKDATGKVHNIRYGSNWQRYFSRPSTEDAGHEENGTSTEDAGQDGNRIATDDVGQQGKRDWCKKKQVSIKGGKMKMDYLTDIYIYMYMCVAWCGDCTFIELWCAHITAELKTYMSIYMYMDVCTTHDRYIIFCPPGVYWKVERIFSLGMIKTLGKRPRISCIKK